MSETLILAWRLQPPQVGQIATIVGPRGVPGILYEETFGDGVSTSFTITHNLHTRKFVANIYATSGLEPDVIADIYRISDDQIRIEFLIAPALDAYCVVLVGVQIPT